MSTRRDFINRITLVLATVAMLAAAGVSQAPRSAKAELGSNTAKNGFKNEDEIRDKFNNWQTDDDAKAWLAAMNYNIAEILSVTATKPHGGKADVEIVVKTRSAEKKDGISIKLVSSENGFNQIDKRWLSHYVKMWQMPTDVETALKQFLGETPPLKAGRDPNRMFLNELEPAQTAAVIDFFSKNKDEIVSDLFAGDGAHAAGWVMVALKSSEKTRWVIKTDIETVKFFSEGKVELTSHGNLKIGQITMQRKGGDGGRDTAKMLQFKINPALLFTAK